MKADQIVHMHVGEIADLVVVVKRARELTEALRTAGFNLDQYAPTFGNTWIGGHHTNIETALRHAQELLEDTLDIPRQAPLEPNGVAS